jgi:GNAT superfamily N-acetyltransferase
MSSTAVNTSSLSVRVADLGDITSLEQIVQLAYRGGMATVPWKNEAHLVEGPRIVAQELEELISADAATILVAESSGDSQTELVGCVLAEKHENEVHVGLLAVSPSCQNSGLGRRLVKAAEDHARTEFKCTTAKMFVLSGREGLLDWYERLGYKRTGETAPFSGFETGQKTRDSDAHFVVISKTL